MTLSDIDHLQRDMLIAIAKAAFRFVDSNPVELGAAIQEYKLLAKMFEVKE